MSVFEDNWKALLHAVHENRMAHAYIIAGSPQGDARFFAMQFARAVYCESPGEPCGSCDTCHRIGHDLHPDVAWIEPQSKSRRILVEQVDELIRRMHQTAYEGRYKVAGIWYADRLNDDAANKFLKTLEEPPGDSLMLLVTDSPQALLATIRSRCQLIQIPEKHEEAADWHAELMEILREGGGMDPISGLGQAGRLHALIEALKKDKMAAAVEEAGEDVDEKVIEARVAAFVRETLARVMKQIERWQRDVLMSKLEVESRYLFNPDDAKHLAEIASGLDLSDCYKRIERVEVMRRKLERNFPTLEAAEAGLCSW